MRKVLKTKYGDKILVMDGAFVASFYADKWHHRNPFRATALQNSFRAVTNEEEADKICKEARIYLMVSEPCKNSGAIGEFISRNRYEYLTRAEKAMQAINYNTPMAVLKLHDELEAYAADPKYPKEAKIGVPLQRLEELESWAHAYEAAFEDIDE
jgi:hypothetical protein